jgi:hypothetical protein
MPATANATMIIRVDEAALWSANPPLAKSANPIGTSRARHVERIDRSIEGSGASWTPDQRKAILEVTRVIAATESHVRCREFRWRIDPPTR